MASTIGASPHRRDSASLLFVLMVIVGAALLAVGWAVSTSNRLVRADQEVRARWSQVRTVDQRSVELVPALVESVQAVVPGELTLFNEVGEARAETAQLSAAALLNALEDPADFRRYQDAHAHLDAAIRRLVALEELHPELAATGRFRDLVAELEGAAGRAALERTRFNEAARAFNVLARRFPTSLVARSLSFARKPTFEVTPEAHDAPAARL